MSPLFENLVCSQCNCTETLLWNCTADKQPLCNDCFEQIKASTKQEPENHRKSDERRSKLRKSTRSTRYNGKNGSSSNNGSGAVTSNASKNNATKSGGRGRRNLYRRPPMKAPTIPATTQHVKSLFFKVRIVKSSSKSQTNVKSLMIFAIVLFVYRVLIFKLAILFRCVIQIMMFSMHKLEAC